MNTVVGLVRAALCMLVLSLMVAPASALDLPAGAVQQASEQTPNGRVGLATARFDGRTVPARAVEGQVTWQAWKIPGTSQGSFQVLTDLRDQLIQDGYEILFQCQAVACGGYDFRFEVGHFKAPDMYVDLGDFHYISAHKSDHHIGLLVSRSSAAAFVEMVQVAPAGSPVTPVTAQTGRPVSTGVAPLSGTLASALEATGRAVLAGVDFATGSSQLTNSEVTALAELATYLTQDTSRRVMLVGHTDAEGGLEGNVALSRKRANSVMTQLVDFYGVDRAQVSAQGVGFLAPLASNLTPEGREQNRRVEAVLINTD